MSHTVTLRNWQHASTTLQRATEWIKNRTANGRAVVLTLADETRNNAQNALLHALLTEISAKKTHGGERHDAETWKRLLTAAWCRANGDPIKILPALDGHGVDIVFRRTSKMSKAEIASLIDYIQAWEATWQA